MINTIQKGINIKNIQFKSNIRNDSYVGIYLVNTFAVFKSINDILYCIYSNKINSIIFYNLIDNKVINSIKNAHDNNITNFRYYYDKKNKYDLIISISFMDNNLKIWNINNFELLLNLKDINKQGFLRSACVLNDGNQNLIITSNDNNNLGNDYIKIFDFKGYQIKELSYVNKDIYYIDNYYDKKLCKYYIITGNQGCCQAIDYNMDKIYHEYNTDTYYSDYGYTNFERAFYFELIILEDGEILKLIGSCNLDTIFIWNFNTTELLSRIEVCQNHELYGLCLWNDNYLFVACGDKTIKLIDVKNEVIIKELTGHKNEILTLKKFFHPEYGECLISQGAFSDSLKLWTFKN